MWVDFLHKLQFLFYFQKNISSLKTYRQKSLVKHIKMTASEVDAVVECATENEVENNCKKVKKEKKKVFNKHDFHKSMQQIYVDRKMTKKEYADLYQMIYDFCCKDRDINIWYEDQTQQTTQNDKAISGTDEMATIISDFITKHIKEEVLKTPPETDEDCLLYYSKEWKDYRLSTNILNNVCRYMNDQRRKRSTEAYTVDQVAIDNWREHMFNHLNEKVSNAAIELLERNRNGEIINTYAIKDVIQSYIDLGSLEKSKYGGDNDTIDLKVYKLFEERVLNATSEYYSKDGESAMQKFYVKGKSFVEYMKFIQTRLNDEFKRTKMLHPTTETPLMQLCYKILIEKHLEIFDGEFKIYLNHDQLNEMELMCSLAIQSDPVIKRLNTIFEQHILQNGQNEMEKCVNEAYKDPRKYIQTMLMVHNKYAKIVREQFKTEVGFKGALDKACSSFVNKNAVTGKAKNPNFSAESLASYCHILLKKSNKSMEDAELEAALDDIMIIFRYIEDKDVFEGFYKRRLADRLVLDLSASDDAEALLISKMKQTCGYEYTNKLQNMYQDIAVSKNLADKFREKNEASETTLESDFRIKVLTHGCWPLSVDISVNWPIELTPTVDRFTAFYHSQHSGRKIMWLHKLSKVELVWNGLKQRYYVKANTLQTAVLLHYNDQLTHTVQQLIEYTGIGKDYMMSLLESMIKMKLLKHADQSQEKLSEVSNIELNTAYNEPKIRFDITAKLESERRAEQKQTLHRIDEDRCHLIEAAIVRIMKMRKTLTNRVLIGEVMNQLSLKFHPKVPHIKKSIEKLIDKEYLERNSTEIDTYNYLA